VPRDRRTAGICALQDLLSSLQGHASQRADAMAALHGAKARLAALCTSAQAACALSNGLIASTSSESKKDNKHCMSIIEKQNRRPNALHRSCILAFKAYGSLPNHPCLGLSSNFTSVSLIRFSLSVFVCHDSPSASSRRPRLLTCRTATPWPFIIRLGVHLMRGPSSQNFAAASRKRSPLGHFDR
jgi:hypothetical protein